MLELLGIATAIGVLLIMVGHWFPWPKPLPRIPRYTYGVSCIVAAFAIWQLSLGEWEALAGLVLICVVLGATTVFCYAADYNTRQLRKAAKAEAVDDELTV